MSVRARTAVVLAAALCVLAAVLASAAGATTTRAARHHHATRHHHASHSARVCRRAHRRCKRAHHKPRHAAKHAVKHRTSKARGGGSGKPSPLSSASPAPAPGSSTGLGSPLAPVTPTGTPPSGEAAPTTPVPARVQVIAREYSFTLSRATVSAGLVTVEFVNRGQDAHNMHLDPLSGGPEAGVFAETRSGAHADETFNMSAGSYTLFCSLPTHEAAGMKATLTVQ